MSRIFGFAVGALWLVFTFLAYQNAQAGWAEGHTDVGFWWSVIAALLGIAALVAFVGTARHRTTGPKK